jgi:glyoxylase-like metal-dependent hydrolase (beta-lactamase superfamily II)
MTAPVQVKPSLAVLKSRLFEMNSGIFVCDDDAYLVDPGIFPDEIDALQTYLSGRKETIHGLIMTHSHWDHILGPERLPGLPVIAHANTAAALASDAAEISRIVDERLTADGFQRATAFVAPSVDVIVSDQLTLPFGGRMLHLLHAPGHCADQVVVYDPGERTLWAADMLSDIEIPFVDDVHAYRLTIERLRSLDIATLVPGHGNFTSDPSEIQSRLTWDHNYLEQLEKEVASSVRSHRTLAQTQAALGKWPLRRPEINAREHLRNIKTVYRASTGP